MNEHIIRKAGKEDIPGIASLILRLKKLNEEFDPFFKVDDNAEKTISNYIQEVIKDKNSLLFISNINEKISGVIRSRIDERIFYKPKRRGNIIDFYVLPEFRRSKVGEQLLQKTYDTLLEKGAKIIVTEFPTQNKIAANFYKKNGYRAIISSYGKVVD